MLPTKPAKFILFVDLHFRKFLSLIDELEHTLPGRDVIIQNTAESALRSLTDLMMSNRDPRECELVITEMALPLNTDDFMSKKTSPYSGLPVVLLAIALGIPVVMHTTDAGPQWFEQIITALNADSKINRVLTYAKPADQVTLIREVKELVKARNHE